MLDEQLFLVITDRGMEMNNLYVAMQTKYVNKFNKIFNQSNIYIFIIII